MSTAPLGLTPSQPAPPPSKKTANPERMLPCIVGCALLMQMLDSTVVTTALPTMAADLGADPVLLNVVITPFLLAIAVFVPINGWSTSRQILGHLRLVALDFFN